VKTKGLILHSCLGVLVCCSVVLAEDQSTPVPRASQGFSWLAVTNTPNKPLGGKLRLPEEPPPGTYKSLPYTALIVVPQKHPVERTILSHPSVEPKLPIVNPDLKLIPRR
jgi:hypothetical protein